MPDNILSESVVEDQLRQARQALSDTEGAWNAGHSDKDVDIHLVRTRQFVSGIEPLCSITN